MITKEVLEELYVKQKLASTAISKKIKVDDRLIRKWLKKYNIPRRTLSEARTIYPKTDFNENLELKSYMLGLRAGDIHAKRMHKIIRVQTSTTRPAQVEMIERTFSAFSHVGKYLFFNKGFDAQEWFIYCDLNESFSFIIQKPEKILDWILENDNYFYNFLAAYSDCEGSWKMLRSHKNGVRLVFQIASQDKEILEQITARLNKLKYTAHLYLEMKAGINKYGIKVNKDMYRFMIYRTQDVIRLAKILLPLSRHQEKIDKMNLILNNQGKKWDEVEPLFRTITKKIKESRLERLPKDSNQVQSINQN